MIEYSAPYARMRGIKGKLFDKTQLEGFLGAPDARSIVASISRTISQGQDQDFMDVFHVEHRLKQELIISYTKILTFLKGKPANFIKLLLGRFELLNAKSIIRFIANKSNTNISVEPFIYSLGKYHTIPLKDALEAGDLKNLTNIMKRTPFGRPMEIGYNQYEASGTIFSLELALDLDYYKRVWDSIQALGVMDKTNAIYLLGTQFDILNILLIYRFKEYYKLPPEQIIQYAIPYGWMININTIQKIALENDVLRTIIENGISPYDSILESIVPIDGNLIIGAEVSLFRYLYKESIKAFMNFPLQIVPLLAFFIIQEMQVRDIITILTGRNLGLTIDRIRAYLITL